MILSKKKLFHLNVRTRSGIFLGRVMDISFDTDSGSVLQYQVRVPHGIARVLPFLFQGDIIFISHAQIAQWKEHELIVEDAALHTYQTAKKTQMRAQHEGSPITSCSSTDRAAPS